MHFAAVCARGSLAAGGTGHRAQGTGPSLTANAGDGRRLAPDFPSSIRFPCTSAPALIDRLHVPQPYTDPSAGSSPPPASASAFPSPFPFPLCFLRPSLPPCATAAAPPPRARPACARPPALLFSLSRRDGPSLASAPATLPRDPHHSSLLASRSSHLALPLHSTRLDSTYLDSPRLAPPPVFMSCAARRLTAAAALPSRLGRCHAPL
jgi:hypothetical protein